MPSDHKKRKFAKRKNKASASQPHQGRLRSHMQILKAPSFGNAKNGKEKHNISEKEAVGNEDREQGEENIFFEFKGGEAANASEMDASENEGSRVSAIATEGISSGAENSQQVDVLKMSALDKSAEKLQETVNSELFESNELRGESVTSVTKVGWSGGLEEKNGEKDTKEIEADNSLEDIPSQVKECVIVTEEGEAGQAAAKKEEVILAYAIDVSAHEKEDKVMIDEHGSMKAAQDDVRDAITPKIEISHPPMVVQRASIWNCCGLLEVFITSNSD